MFPTFIFAGDLVDETPFIFGYIGVAIALVFSNIGSAYGCSKSGLGIAYYGVLKPEGIIKAIIPVIMAGILGIYGLVVSVLLLSKSKYIIFICKTNNFISYIIHYTFIFIFILIYPHD